MGRGRGNWQRNDEEGGGLTRTGCRWHSVKHQEEKDAKRAAAPELRGVGKLQAGDTVRAGIDGAVRRVWL